MSGFRGTTAFTPAFIRAVAARQLRTSSGPLSGRAVALLIPRRAQHTDTTSSSSSSSNPPPPGFNAEQAKKPLSKQEDQTKSQAKAEAEEASSTPLEDAAEVLNKSQVPSEVGRLEATAIPRTPAQDAKVMSELSAESATVVEAQSALGKDVEVLKKKGEKKLTLWQKVKKEAAHYWDGTKLLATEVKISTRLALKMAGGYELSRRESRQVRVTLAARHLTMIANFVSFS